MCGISGILSLGPPRPLGPVLLAMNRAQGHRGPDDGGYATWAGGEHLQGHADDNSHPRIKESLPHLERDAGREIRAGLGHKRFSIIDVTPGGHQPWLSPSGETALVFNGEIYNYLELRTRLEAEGHGPFTTSSDTEVLARAYAAWGEECLERSVGFWALAVLDLPRRRLLLSRDRLGKKPLYLWQPDGETLVFASELKAILAAAAALGRSLALDADALMLYLLYDRRNTLKGSLWQEVKLLPPGAIVSFDLDGGARRERLFWQAPQERMSRHDLSLDQAAATLKETLADAVRLRLRSDVTLAADLSGGMDSSSIVALAQGLLPPGRRLRTNLIRYPDAPEFDEKPWADAVAKKVGCDHHELWVDSGETWDLLDRLVEALEEPVHSLAYLTQWMGWRSASREGIKVILHGAAGDELLAGYSYLTTLAQWRAINDGDWRRYLENYPLADWRGHLRAGKWFLKGLVLPDLANPLRRLRGLPDRRRHNRDFHPRLFQTWFAEGFLARTTAMHQEFDRRFLAADTGLGQRMLADVEWLRIPYWVNAMDKSMMSLPVEVRMPFLDHRVVELLLRLPVEYLYGQGWSKLVLRRAMEDLLPPAVNWRRRKVGFTIPKQRWLDRHRDQVRVILTEGRDGLSPYVQVDRMLADLGAVPKDILWRTINTARWMQVFRPRPA